MHRLEFKPGIGEVARTLYGFRRHPLEELSNIKAKYGDRAVYKTPIRDAIFLFDPRDASQVLQQDTKSVDKKTFDQRIMHAIGGQSVLTLPGNDMWQHQRELAQPAFSHEMLGGYSDVISRQTSEMFAQWDDKPRQPDGMIEIDDAESEMMHLTIKIISESLFHHNVNSEEAVRLSTALNDVSDFFTESVRRLSLPWHLRHLPLPKNRNFFAQIEYLKNFAYSILDQRQEMPVQPHDLLSFLGGDGESATQGVSRDELRDNLLAFLVAGHATTTSALTWTFINLSKSEGQKYKGFNPRMCFEESMRLYPPSWIITRRSTDDIILDDSMTIPKGSFVAMSPYLIHRHPDYWEDPEAFRPERFDRSQSKPSPTFTFGRGPRSCVGAPLGMLEGPQILEMLSDRYDFSVVGADNIKPGWQAILRPEGKVKMLLQPK